ncbi:polysaccharide pyruvyl transferase family protein [Gracilibacillus caseinilyticus]|uniref:Polysaccharide pyruvyl transferase family protein n=1 Tax=Gracilibacillus caseinilyticus TaxID=2932256 RepID=A0ABY4F763_9BACI|nr:polysaccharide pyruvyl transferase family protein [Gracilibacillus caseinilyticus]UOQ50291.1 polysaccharide pyruvyl transferase family protein [Gracilibacillus caseinilyticus]
MEESMLIGIVGNYGNNNKGDEAILEGILLQLEEMFQLDRSNIIVFSNQPEKTTAQYGVQSQRLYYKKNNAVLTMFRTMRRNAAAIRQLDLLIVGGGGIFMDLYGREAFLFGMYGWLAKLTRTPVVLYGVGAGPILTKTGKLLLRSLAHLSDLVTVRDPNSKKLLQAIGVKSPVHVIGDPAFQIEAPKEQEATDSTSLKIGVTAVPYYHKSYWPREETTYYERYVTGMVANLDALAEVYPDCEIQFFSTKYPQDVQVTEDIQRRMKYRESTRIQEYLADPKEIAQFASEQDIVIGTRLHSLILALVSGTPVISVSYHHKVEDFMGMIGMGQYSIPIEKLDQDAGFFVQSIEVMRMNWTLTKERFGKISSKMRKEAFTGMELVKERIIERTKQPKVLVLSNMYPSKHSRTFGIFVKNQVELLKEKGVQAHVISIKDPRKGKARLLKKYGLFFARNLWHMIWKGWRYDTVHVHYIFPTGIVGLAYKYLFNKKLVVTSHGGDIDQMIKKNNRVRQLSEHILQKADDIIVVGEGLKQDIHDNFSVDQAKISVINMGVNRSVFKPAGKAFARQQLGLPADQEIILFIGNLIYAKGLDDLAEATASLKEKHPQLVTHLIGEPKDASYFEQFQQQYRSEAIKVHGSISQEELALWLSAADCFVLPSHIEGFGLVALEAMSCHVPVVGTDVGGLTYLLADQTGLKVKPKDPDDLADKIDQVLTYPALANTLVENGRLKAEAYDQNRLIESILAIYKQNKN